MLPDVADTSQTLMGVRSRQAAATVGAGAVLPLVVARRPRGEDMVFLCSTP